MEKERCGRHFPKTGVRAGPLTPTRAGVSKVLLTKIVFSNIYQALNKIYYALSWGLRCFASWSGLPALDISAASQWDATLMGPHTSL
uniref:Uncharacterized protein n=1 Tax=Arundo donax TaxID=35708 RepID=A0A0A9AIV8_ARUDO